MTRALCERSSIIRETQTIPFFMHSSLPLVLGQDLLVMVLSFGFHAPRAYLRHFEGLKILTSQFKLNAFRISMS